MTRCPDRVAHFQMCRCGQHGRIVFPDGRTGGEIASKEEIAAVLQYVMLVDKFQRIEIFPAGELRYIMSEVDSSTLVASNEQVSEYFRKEINTWNTAKLHQPALNPDDFHVVMEKLWSYSANDD